jgi:hypothetical protein
MLTVFNKALLFRHDRKLLKVILGVVYFCKPKRSYPKLIKV